MSIGEDDTLSRQSIKIRSPESAIRIQGRNVSISQIVAQYHQKIRPLRRGNG